MYRSFIVRPARLSPQALRYRRLPQFIRSAHARQALQNPSSLLALAYRALHRPYSAGNRRITSRYTNRRRIQPRNPVRRSSYYRL